jgi:hypothetical protein
MTVWYDPLITRQSHNAVLFSWALVRAGPLQGADACAAARDDWLGECFGFGVQVYIAVVPIGGCTGCPALLPVQAQ